MCPLILSLTASNALATKVERLSCVALANVPLSTQTTWHWFGGGGGPSPPGAGAGGAAGPTRPVLPLGSLVSCRAAVLPITFHGYFALLLLSVGFSKSKITLKYLVSLASA